MLGPSRPGSGKCFGIYKTPWLAKSKGEPTSSICTFAGSTSPALLSLFNSSPTRKPILFAKALNELPTVNVADVAITGVWVNRFSRKTSDTESGAKCKVEKVGSYQRTKPSPSLSNVAAVVEISLTAPFTRARSAKISVSMISSSAERNCVIAWALSRTFLMGDSSDCGISSSRPWAKKSPLIDSP